MHLIVNFHVNHLDIYLFYTNIHAFIPENLPPYFGLPGIEDPTIVSYLIIQFLLLF